MLSLTTVRDWVLSRKGVLLFLLVLAIGSWLRIYDLGAESLWLDEAISENFVKGNVAYIINESALQHNTPPLYWLILHYWTALLGNSEVALRSLSAILGIGAILITYLVGKELFNHKVGLIGSLLSAISYFHIYYSQEARAYALLLFLSLLSYFFFIRIFKRDGNWYYPCYFLTNILLGYVHIYGLFIIASQVLYFILYHRSFLAKRCKLIATLSATVVGLSPLVILMGPMTMSLMERGFWIERPSPIDILDTFHQYAGYGLGSHILLILFFLLAVLGLFSIRKEAGKWIIRKPIDSLRTISWRVGFESIDELVLLILWLAFPILIPFIASQVTTPFYFYRYTIGASPALYLIVAKGINTFKTKRLLYSVLLVIIILSAFGLHSYYVHDVKEQWREAAEFVEINSREGDVILDYEAWGHSPFEYYYKGDLPIFKIPHRASVQEVATLTDQVIGGKDRLWLIVWEGYGSPMWDYLTGKYAAIWELDFNGASVLLVDLPVDGSD